MRPGLYSAFAHFPKRAAKILNQQGITKIVEDLLMIAIQYIIIQL